MAKPANKKFKSRKFKSMIQPVVEWVTNITAEENMPWVGGNGGPSTWQVFHSKVAKAANGTEPTEVWQARLAVLLKDIEQKALANFGKQLRPLIIWGFSGRGFSSFEIVGGFGPWLFSLEFLGDFRAMAFHFFSFQKIFGPWFFSVFNFGGFLNHGCSVF